MRRHDTFRGRRSDSWHNGVGLGLRFFLKGVVLPLVGKFERPLPLPFSIGEPVLARSGATGIVT